METAQTVAYIVLGIIALAVFAFTVRDLRRPTKAFTLLRWEDSAGPKFGSRRHRWAVSPPNSSLGCRDRGDCQVFSEATASLQTHGTSY
jgi:hypothetical protein